MASITFVDYSTVVPASWLNDVNSLTYSGMFPATTLSVAIGTTPLAAGSNGNMFYVYNSLNTGTVESNSTVRIQSVNRNANVQIIGGTSFEAGVQFLSQAAVFLGGMTYNYATGDIFWRTSPGGVATEQMRLTAAGSLIMTGASSTMGYGTGSGGTVTQLTNKATTVTLNKGSGQIVMNAASLAANTTVAFLFLNSLITSTDTLVCHVQAATSGANNYNVFPYGGGVGSIGIALRNNTGGALAEAVTINFAVIKGVTS